MNKSNTLILKWIVVGCFAVPLLGIFLPYYSSSGFSMSGFDAIKASFGSKFSGILNGIEYLCASLLFCLAAAVILMIKENVVTYTLAAFAGVSTAMKFIPVFVSAIESKSPGIGLVINTLCFTGGAVIAIILLIPRAKEVFKTSQAAGGMGRGYGQMAGAMQGQQTGQVPPPPQPFEMGAVPPQQTGQVPPPPQPFEMGAVPPQQGGQVPPPQPGAAPYQQAATLCPNCGSPLRPGAQFCMTCGTRCV